MKGFVFHAAFEPGRKRGIVVSFQDVPEAITQGADEADAYAMAEEALGLALLSYARRLGKHWKEARRILDPRHPTKLPTLVAALHALGKRLVVRVESAA